MKMERCDQWLAPGSEREQVTEETCLSASATRRQQLRVQRDGRGRLRWAQTQGSSGVLILTSAPAVTPEERSETKI